MESPTIISLGVVTPGGNTEPLGADASGRSGVGLGDEGLSPEELADGGAFVGATSVVSTGSVATGSVGEVDVGEVCEVGGRGDVGDAATGAVFVGAELGNVGGLDIEGPVVDGVDIDGADEGLGVAELGTEAVPAPLASGERVSSAGASSPFEHAAMHPYPASAKTATRRYARNEDHPGPTWGSRALRAGSQKAFEVM